MASGLADHYRGMRPRFGGAKRVSGSKELVKSVENILFTITGKGMVYGGTLWLDYTSTQANSEPGLIVDGQQLSDLSFLRLNEYGIDKPGSSVITINRYDADEFIYSAGISYGVTFESSIELTYLEEHGVTPTVHYRFVYALI